MGTLSEGEKIRHLKRAPIFSTLGENELKKIAVRLSEEEVEDGTVIVMEGDPGDKLYIIVEGRVVVTKKNELGREGLVMVFGPEECFGEMAILDGEPRSATVKAVEKTKLLSISGEDFRSVIRTYPDVAFQIFKVLTDRLRTATMLYTRI